MLTVALKPLEKLSCLAYHDKDVSFICNKMRKPVLLSTVRKKRWQQTFCAVFNAPSTNEAKKLLDLLIDKYQDSIPKLIQWAEDNIPEGLTVFGLLV